MNQTVSAGPLDAGEAARYEHGFITLTRIVEFPMPKPATADPEMIAIGALGFLAEDPARLSRFLDTTGLNPATLRQAASEPRFLASVLDYLMADESLMLAFAAHNGTSPETVAAAGAALARF